MDEWRNIALLDPFQHGFCIVLCMMMQPDGTKKRIPDSFGLFLRRTSTVHQGVTAAKHGVENGTSAAFLLGGRIMKKLFLIVGVALMLASNANAISQGPGDAST